MKSLLANDRTTPPERQGVCRPSLHFLVSMYNEVPSYGEFLFQMIEELKDEGLVRKIGGRFKLSALIQKRLVALNEGTPSAIDYGRGSSPATRDRLNTTIQEILRDKIYLNTEAGGQIRRDEGVSMVFDTEFTEGY